MRFGGIHSATSLSIVCTFHLNTVIEICILNKILQGWHNYSILKDLLGDGIFTVDGDKWREQRKVSSHEFSTRVLRDFSSVIFRRNVIKLAKIVSEAANTGQIIDIQVSHAVKHL